MAMVKAVQALSVSSPSMVQITIASRHLKPFTHLSLQQPHRDSLLKQRGSPSMKWGWPLPVLDSPRNSAPAQPFQSQKLAAPGAHQKAWAGRVDGVCSSPPVQLPWYRQDERDEAYTRSLWWNGALPTSSTFQTSALHTGPAFLCTFPNLLFITVYWWQFCDQCEMNSSYPRHQHTGHI